MLNSTCLLPQPLILDVFAHLVFLISLPTYGTALWVLCSKFPLHFQKYRFLLILHIVSCLLMELHMSIFWKMVGAVPWAAVCAQGIAAEYVVQCFQVFVVLLIATGASVINLFKQRMNAASFRMMETLKRVAGVFEYLAYVSTCFAALFLLLSFPALRHQMDYKKLIEQKFGGLIPMYIWCDNCFFIRFDSTLVILFFVFGYFTIVSLIIQCSVAFYVSFKSLKSTRCQLSEKTIALQKNFLNSLIIMISIHTVFMVVPVLLFLFAHIVPFPNYLMPLSHTMVLLMQEHGTASAIAMLLTNKLLFQSAKDRFNCIRRKSRRISRIDTAIEATE